MRPPDPVVPRPIAARPACASRAARRAAWPRPLPLLPLLALVVAAACGGDGPTGGGEPAAGPPLAAGQVAETERWLVFARGILGRRETGGPTRTTRQFALVAVAQYNAAVAAATVTVPAGRARPSESAAVAAASAAVLRALYPVEGDSIAALVADDSAQLARFETASGRDVAAGSALGAQAAAAVLARAATDRTDLVWNGVAPTGPDVWTSAPGAAPVSPRWGEARGWVLPRGDAFRPAPPPPVGSPAFTASLAAVRAATDARTPAQLQLAQFWQFGAGPAGAPGLLTARALGLSRAARLTERETARTLALWTMAAMDATIACWDAKYAQWYPRPFARDPGITTPVGRPNFPSWPSAHSCLTASAATVLAALFPDSAAALEAMPREAGASRVWAGLHYDFDITAGEAIGRAAGTLVLQRAPSVRRPVPLD